MPRIIHEHEQEIRRAIRDAYALDPIMTQKKLLEFLEKRFGKSFDHRFISRLVKKVSGETMPRLDQQKVEARLKEIRETFRLGRENLLQIAFGNGDPRPTPGERNAAWRTIAMMQKLQLDAEIELGIYNKQIPDADKEAFRFRPVPPEIMENIIRTFARWQLPGGLTRKIEPPPVVIDAKPVQFVEKNNAPVTHTKPKPAIPLGPRPDPEFVGIA